MVYTFTGAVAYDRLGSSWRTAAGLRSVSVTDPATGLLPANLVQGGVSVMWLTADANSRYSFTCEVPGVVVDFGAGSQVLYANEVPGLAIAAGGATNTAIDARMKWAPSTAYTLGQQILSPNNDVVKANVAHTSAAAYATDVAKWDLGATFATVAGRPISAYDYGVRAGTGTDQKTALYAAMAAAEAAGGGTVVELPPGIVTVAGSLSLSGYSCGLVGHGASTVSAGSNVPAGTVLQAITQTGPVLDFTGWRGPTNFIGRVMFGGFTIVGDGVAGVANKGIYMGDSSNNGGPVIGISMRDITITNTGGIGLDMKAVYLSDFDAITITNPIAAGANNTSYVRIAGGNGCRIRGLGLRSLLTTGDVPALGALRCTAEGTNPFHDALIDGLWLENLHVPTGGAAVIMQTNLCVISDMQVFDTFKETGATGTSIVRFEPSGVGNEGGNILRGVIPGNNTATNCIDNGVDLRQNGNRVEGVKGYRRWNVILAAGVDYCYVQLGGAEGGLSGATVGIVDNSGTTTNVLMDAHAPLVRVFTPVLTASVTNPTLGNGSAFGRWTRLADGTVHYSGLVTFGTTTIVGSGNYSISLPVPADATVDYHGSGRAATTGASAQILPKTATSGTVLQFFAPTTTAASPVGLLANTGLCGTAWVLSSATTIRWSITYQAAS